jgi:hypothetical protein
MEVSNIAELAEVGLQEANKRLKAGWVYLRCLVILKAVADGKYTEQALFVIGRPDTVKG